MRDHHDHQQQQVKSALFRLLWEKRRGTGVGEDTAEEAQRCRMGDISDQTKVTLSDLEKTVEEWANNLFCFCK